MPTKSPQSPDASRLPSERERLTVGQRVDESKVDATQTTSVEIIGTPVSASRPQAVDDDDVVVGVAASSNSASDIVTPVAVVVANESRPSSTTCEVPIRDSSPTQTNVAVIVDADVTGTPTTN